MKILSVRVHTRNWFVLYVQVTMKKLEKMNQNRKEMKLSKKD